MGEVESQRTGSRHPLYQSCPSLFLLHLKIAQCNPLRASLTAISSRLNTGVLAKQTLVPTIADDPQVIIDN